MEKNSQIHQKGKKLIVLGFVTIAIHYFSLWKISRPRINDT